MAISTTYITDVSFRDITITTQGQPLVFPLFCATRNLHRIPGMVASSRCTAGCLAQHPKAAAKRHSVRTRKIFPTVVRPASLGSVSLLPVPSHRYHLRPPLVPNLCHGQALSPQSPILDIYERFPHLVVAYCTGGGHTFPILEHALSQLNDLKVLQFPWHRLRMQCSRFVNTWLMGMPPCI